MYITNQNFTLVLTKKKPKITIYSIYSSPSQPKVNELWDLQCQKILILTHRTKELTLSVWSWEPVTRRVWSPVMTVMGCWCALTPAYFTSRRGSSYPYVTHPLLLRSRLPPRLCPACECKIVSRDGYTDSAVPTVKVSLLLNNHFRRLTSSK